MRKEAQGVLEREVRMKRKIEKATIARTVVLIFSLINMFLTMFNLNPLPFSEDEVYTGVTCLFTVAAALWNWWKDNNITQKALERKARLEEKP